MPIKLNCPRCKTPLQVPSKKAGGYVNCPHCKGRLWVSKDDAEQSVPTAPMAEPPPSDHSPYSPPVSKSTEPHPPAAESKTPHPPEPKKKVARFISTEAADSTLRLAADGNLPELHLDEGKGKHKQDKESKSMNPLLLLGVLSVSVVVSIMLAVMGPQPYVDSRANDKAEQRYFIKRDYFGSRNIEDSDLKPYQILLRDAQVAHSSWDFKTERECYRQVLDMLRAERGPDRNGLTGSRRRDKKLEKAISILLSGE